MSAGSRLKEELRAVGLYTLFFGAWFSAFMLLKALVLAEYEIRYSGLSAVLVGALVLAKVALLLEHVSLGAGSSSGRRGWKSSRGPSVHAGRAGRAAAGKGVRGPARGGRGAARAGRHSPARRHSARHRERDVAACALLVFDVLR